MPASIYLPRCMTRVPTAAWHCIVAIVTASSVTGNLVEVAAKLYFATTRARAPQSEKAASPRYLGHVRGSARSVVKERVAHDRRYGQDGEMTLVKLRDDGGGVWRAAGGAVRKEIEI